MESFTIAVDLCWFGWPTTLLANTVLDVLVICGAFQCCFQADLDI